MPRVPLLLGFVLLLPACITDFVGEPEDPVLTELTFVFIEPGDGFACGLTQDGTAYCWGALADRGGGDRADDVQSVPLPLPGGLRFTSISVGYLHACGVTTAGQATCWGWNYARQLGPASVGETCQGESRGDVAPCSTTPVPVDPALSFTQLSAGPEHTCGLTSDSLAYCWGSNQSQQLGRLPDTSASAQCGNAIFGTRFQCGGPAPVLGNVRFSTISSGAGHTCAVTGAGVGYCWGTNQLLGNDSLLDGLISCPSSSSFGFGSCAAPIPVLGGETFQLIAAGDQHSCGLSTDGSVSCWGRGDNGQLGPSASSAVLPVAVPDAGPVTSLSASAVDTCGLTAAGSAVCWGRDFGIDEALPQFAPIPAPEGARFVTLSAGGGSLFVGNPDSRRSFCAVTDGGVGYCWGFNFFGQLGNGSRTATDTPTRVRGTPTT